MRMPLSVAIGLSLLCHAIVLTQGGWQLPATEVAVPISPLSVTWVQQTVAVNTAPPPAVPAVAEASITLPPVKPSPTLTEPIPEPSETSPTVAATPAETAAATAAQRCAGPACAPHRRPQQSHHQRKPMCQCSPNRLCCVMRFFMAIYWQDSPS